MKQKEETQDLDRQERIEKDIKLLARGVNNNDQIMIYLHESLSYMHNEINKLKAQISILNKNKQ